METETQQTELLKKQIEKLTGDVAQLQQQLTHADYAVQKEKLERALFAKKAADKLSFTTYMDKTIPDAIKHCIRIVESIASADFPALDERDRETRDRAMEEAAREIIDTVQIGLGQHILKQELAEKIRALKKGGSR